MKMASFFARPVHTMYGIGAWCVGVLTGVVLARYLPIAWWVYSWPWLVVWLLVSLLLVRVRCTAGVLLLLLVGSFLGCTRGLMDRSTIDVLSPLYGTSVLVRGVVAEDVGAIKSNSATLRLQQVSVNNHHQVAGVVWVTVAGVAEDVRRSDTVAVKGVIKEGFGSFSAVVQRATIVSVQREVGRDPFVDLRDWLSGGIHQMLGEREAALGAGYVLGQKRALSADFEEALRIAGLTHVVVASGYNLTILVRVARRLFAKVSRYMAAVSASIMVLVFIGITGASPSMMRAGMVAGLSLLAWYYGRKLHPIMILLITAAVSVLVQPSYAWGDIGWLLSFAAFAGVMLFAPVLQAYFFGDKEPGAVRQILGETFAAQLYTLPIIMMSFGTVSVVSMMANMLILPFVPLAMLLVFITGLASLWLPWLAGVVAVPTQALLSYMTWVIDVVSQVSWAAYTVEIDMEWLLVMYVVIIATTVWLYRHSSIQYREVNIVK